MSSPTVLLKKSKNQLLCGIFIFDQGKGHIKHIVLSSPYDFESIITDIYQNILFVLGIGRKSVLLWKTSTHFQDGENLMPFSMDQFSTPQIERIFAFNANRTLASAMLYSFQIVVYQLSSPQLKVSSVVDTSGQSVIDAKFHHNVPDVLILMNQDRSFRIWNISPEPTMIYQSHVVSGSVPSCLTLSPYSNQMAIAFINGAIVSYTVATIKASQSTELPASIFQLDLAKKVQSYLRRLPVSTIIPQSVKSNDFLADAPGVSRAPRKLFFTYVYPSSKPVEERDVNVDISILNMLYHSKSITSDPESLNIHGEKHYTKFVIFEQLLEFSQSFIPFSEIRDRLQHLLILLPAFVIRLNLANLEIEEMISLPGNIISGTFGIHEDTGDAYCTVSTPEDVTVVLLNGGEIASKSNIENKLSIIPLEPVHAGSVLAKAKVKPKQPKDTAPQLYKPISEMNRKPGTLDRKGKIVDNQPITFHHKVKSSGYASLAPFTNGTQKKPVVKQALGRSHSSSNVKQRSALEKLSESRYPMSGPPPSELNSVIALSERPTSTSCFQTSSDGKFLAFSLTDGLIGTVSTKNLANPRMFVHHRQCTRSVAWSKCGAWLAGCSDDGTGSIWSFNTGELLLEVNDDNGLAFKKPMNHIQFYYMDQFFMLTVGNSLHLYSCGLTMEKSDVKRYQVNSVVKRLFTYTLENAMTITSAKAANTLNSYLAICAGSDHSISIIDFNVGKCAAVIEEAHPKSIHSISLAADLVANAAVPQSVYNLFATMAMGETATVKLWDIRENTAVRTLQGFVNRSCPFVNVSFSPCARFITTGSEDRSAYVFDIRSDRPIEKLEGGPNRRHTETVTSVSYNPTRPQLFVGTLDGNLYNYVTRERKQ